jgi:hypothetical protein
LPLLKFALRSTHRISHQQKACQWVARKKCPLPNLLPRVQLHLALQVIAGSEALRSCIALHLSLTPTFTSRYFTPDQLQKRRPFLDSDIGLKLPYWVARYSIALDCPHKNIHRLYELESEPPNTFDRGVMYPGARVQLSDGVHLDLYLGMKAKGEMDRFVMGVYLPTTNHTLCVDKDSGATQQLREGGVYPLYADCSDPSNTTGRAHIRFGPNLLRLSKEELKSITEVRWEWNNYKKLRRPCGLGVVHFGKEVLDVKAVLLEIKKAKDSQRAQGWKERPAGAQEWWGH